MNLPAPDGTNVVRPEALLVPPVGFDDRGYRLGYGGGYFDRTLAVMVPQPLKIGLAFELSRIPSIHPQAHDVPMDFVVTEAGVHHVNEEGLQIVSEADRILELASAIMRAREHAARGYAASVHGYAIDDDRFVVREYASPPCYIHELDALYKDV